MEIMSGGSSLSASNELKAVLAELARSELRGEADRARAILLTLSGWTSPPISAACSVNAACGRHWRQWFVDGGAEAVRAPLAAGPFAETGERAWLWPARS